MDNPVPSAPQYIQPPLDPSFVQAQQKSQEADVAAIQDRVKGDTASLLTRFGQQPQIATAAAAPTPPTSFDSIFSAGGFVPGMPLTPFLSMTSAKPLGGNSLFPGMS